MHGLTHCCNSAARQRYLPVRCAKAAVNRTICLYKLADVASVQMGEEKLRIEEDESNTRKRLKEMREDHKKWEETRDNRVRCRACMHCPASFGHELELCRAMLDICSPSGRHMHGAASNQHHVLLQRRALLLPCHVSCEQTLS